MYKTLYETIARDSGLNYRRIEHDILISAVREIQSAIEIDPTSIEAIKACATMQKIWAILVIDVMSDNNKLPIELRAQIISVGIWIQREISDIMAGNSDNFVGVIEITQIIADGLV